MLQLSAGKCHFKAMRCKRCADALHTLVVGKIVCNSKYDTWQERMDLNSLNNVCLYLFLVFHLYLCYTPLQHAYFLGSFFTQIYSTPLHKWATVIDGNFYGLAVA